MGFDESAAALAREFVWIQVASNIVSGCHGKYNNIIAIHVWLKKKIRYVAFLTLISNVHHKNIIVGAFNDFLEVCEKEIYVTFMYTIGSVCDVAIMVLYFELDTSPTLVKLGLILLANELLFVIVGIAIPKMMGWLRKYDFSVSWDAFFSSSGASKQLIKTAIPLSFGNLVAYGEWELLTIFAAILGPAEVAT